MSPQLEHDSFLLVLMHSDQQRTESVHDKYQLYSPLKIDLFKTTVIPVLIPTTNTLSMLKAIPNLNKFLKNFHKHLLLII